jgi:catechol 2,3-dioxygenase-like lactoylglutathione lyase family enzyme
MRAVQSFGSPEVILFSADPERAAAFYERFGFVERFRTLSTGTAIHVDVELDGYRIGFADLESARRDHGLAPAVEGQRATITLWTDDVRAAYSALVDDGVTGLAGPSVWLDRLLIAWIADPDGNAVQLVQRLGSVPDHQG